MSKIFKLPILRLQLFNDGGDGGTGEGNGVSVGVPSLQSKGDKNPLANVKYGVETQTANVSKADDVPLDRNVEFEKLIKGEYKDLYDQRVQDTIQKRLKGTKETVDKYNALTPTLDILSKKYGVDASDIEALNKAIEEDDSYFEDEALEKGITVEQLKEIRKMERENASLKREMDERRKQENADRLMSDWINQSESLKNIYPGFDLGEELSNKKFCDLLGTGIDVRTAYEVIHKDEIIPAAMQFTARQVEQKLANKIMSNGNRPVENGMSSQSSVIVKSDVSQLSKADRQEIARRVARGERITF